MTDGDDSGRREISKAMPISRRALKSAFTGKLPEIANDIQSSWNTYRAVRTNLDTFGEFNDRVAALVASANAFKQPAVKSVAELLGRRIEPIYKALRQPDETETKIIDQLVLRLFEEAASLSERPTIANFDGLAINKAPKSE